MKGDYMKKMIKKIQNEEGSSTIEFLGILPILIIILLFIVQMIVSVQSVLVAQSAANEAAKVYAVTQDRDEAIASAKEIVLAGGSYLSFSSATGMNSKDFKATVNVEIALVFLPKKIFLNHQTPSLSFSSSASGKVIKNEF